MSPIDRVAQRIVLAAEMRTKWMETGLCTRPLDRECAEQAVYRAYDIAGLKLPKEVLVVDSPRQGLALVQKMRRDAPFNRFVADRLTHPRLGEVRFQLPPVRTDPPSKGSPLRDVEYVVDRLRGLLESALITAGLRGGTDWRWGRQRHGYVLGQHEAAWLCYADYHSALGAGSSYALRGLIETARECGWWWPFEQSCVIAAKPTQIALDARNRPHSASGPAITYADGFRLWALSGVRITPMVFGALPRLNARRIEAERNVEVRRALIEHYGQERFLLESRAIKIHQDDFGTLYYKTMPEDEPLVMVKVVNATPEPGNNTYRDYFLRVPPHIRTAREAVAWTFGRAISAYSPEKQT